MKRRSISAIMVVFVAMAAGCSSLSGGTTLYQRLQDEDPAVRINAIHQAGEQRDRKAVPYLVDRLSDSDQDVRFYAIIALHKITGQTMGYRYFDPPAQQWQAITRWRKWLESGQNQASSTPVGQTSAAPAPATGEPDFTPSDGKERP